MNSRENLVARRLIEHFGGRGHTARALKRSTETIRLWLENGIPLSQAIDVEEACGGIVTAEEILSDARAARKTAACTVATDAAGGAAGGDPAADHDKQQREAA